jgi:excisionase family DNA binding protein
MGYERPVARRGPVEEPEWLTLGQAARFLGVAQSTMRKWSDAGRVTAFYTPGGHRRFRRDELEAFVASSASGGRRSGPLVLVVDDDERLRESIRIALEQAGYGVLEAEDAGAAIVAIDRNVPDLVLLDVVMPGLDGWQLLRRLEERHGSVPLVMYSGPSAGRDVDPDQLVARARRLVSV